MACTSPQLLDPRRHSPSTRVATRPGGALAPKALLVGNPLGCHSSEALRGIAVSTAPDGGSALEALTRDAFDIVLLDMPAWDGLALIGRLRRTSSVPVMVLAAEATEAQRVLALDLGADDFLVSPHPGPELAARVRSVLRRSAGRLSAHVTFGPLDIAVAERDVTLGDATVPTTAREFDLLLHLASNPRRAWSREELLRAVWPAGEHWQDPATVTEHVHRLRRKIEANPGHPRWIRTVRGVGYRFEPPLAVPD